MARIRDRHSRLVALLKIVLPLVALVMLSTIFLVSRTIDPEDALPYSTVDIEGRAMDPRLTLPTWSGVTADGALLSIAAAEARPPTKDRPASMTAMRVDLNTQDGVRTRMQSASGIYDPNGGQVTLTGQVHIYNSQGYDIRMPEANMFLDRTEMTGDGPITAQAPMGQLTAGGMTLTVGQAGAGNYLLDFTDGVKLIYTPTKE
ncbi:LPS export ABC transporter periplasmic protein LptC [Falsirhodobacter sp. alg1]|uniref:LPS export ABC transporter periplasmic protein LptC n=1 Tax=Falsirhodobacter sp. alg1 TaxID=1472418 RepID=UPI0005EE17AE|nr:LPS export ABC transporter periplasmic protein LptC [Falsirhodobacter sp. alg1]